MNATSAARKTLPPLMIALAGCGEFDEADEGHEPRTSGMFLVRRVAEEAGKYSVAPVNGGFARCADGRASTTCTVAHVDLAALGLPEAQERALLASASASEESPTLVVRGALTGSRFVAAEAWRAPVEAPVRGAFHRVSTAGSACSFLPCAAVSEQRVNVTTVPVAIAGVDLAGLDAMDPVSRDLALGAAASDTGLLVAGTREDEGGARTLHAEQVFLRVRPAVAPGRCGDELRAVLADASSRLLYSSATDAPFTYFAREDVAEVPSPEGFRALVAEAANHPVRAVSLDAFLGPLMLDAPAEGLAERHRAARFRLLARALRDHLSDVTVFVAGGDEARAWVVGRTACGGIAGLSTFTLAR